MRKRYTLLVMDRSTGVVRSATISLRAVVGTLTLMMSLPILIGLGADLSARAEIERLRTLHMMLDEENVSYRAATSAFTEQIRSLENAIDTLWTGGGANRVPTSPQGIAPRDRLRAGDGAIPASRTATAAAWLPPLPPFSSPEDVFGALRGVLQGLTNRLPSIQQSLERRQALAGATPSIWPAQGWLTAPFGARSDPFTGERGFHQGIDISTAEGQPVYATADGVVDSASYAGDYGNLIILQHRFGLATRYGHLSAFAVAAGASVKRGDVIGYVGATGRATGPHLHYEILVNGTPIDPLQMLTTVVGH